MKSRTIRTHPANIASRLGSWLYDERDISTLAYVRIVFGATMTIEVLRYFFNGWIPEFVSSGFVPKYYGFEWVQALPLPGVYIVFGVLGLASVLILLGQWYRPSIAIFFVLFTYVFLLDASRYLNHFYLIALLSFLMLWLPADRAYSLRAKLTPADIRQRVPNWTITLLRFQLAIVYFYGGLAKLSYDWLHGEPMRAWLLEITRTHESFSLLSSPGAVWFFVMGGLAFDLLIVPFLLIKRTRKWAFIAAVAFHGMNSQLFHIGIFPWLMLGLTVIFFPSSAITKLLALLKIPRGTGSGQAVKPRIPPVFAALVGLYCVFQLLFPLRHFLYPGDVNWTEQGHRFSWQMKLRTKAAMFAIEAHEPRLGQSDSTWLIDPHNYMTPDQYDIVAGRPDLILEFAHYITAQLQQSFGNQLWVSTRAAASLNGRAPQWMIDSTVNLSTTPRSLRPASWILPLYQPLRLSYRARAETGVE